KKNSLQIEELQEQHNRQEYAHKVILQFLEAQIQNSNSGLKEISNKLYFSHLTYLYEVINNPTKVLVNIQKMSTKYFCERNNVSLIDLFYFQQLKLQILQDYKIHLFDSNIENQQLNMMEVILFDDKINICKEKLRMILFEIGHSMIFNIYIQLIDFQNRRVKEFQKAAVDHSLHKSGERHLFGLDKKGFIFPMSLRIKIQVFENDLGVCALVQKKKQLFSYIFFQNDGTITDLSKKIYFDIFKNLGFKNGQQFNHKVINKVEQNLL
ncbi:hypothetical protein ABPG74_011457, partial [Tetrahymena malaccensis]